VTVAVSGQSTDRRPSRSFVLTLLRALHLDRGSGPDRVQRRRPGLRDGCLPRRHRQAAVGQPLHRPREQRPGPLRGRESRQDHGVRDRVEREPDNWLRLRHRRLPRLRQPALPGQRTAWALRLRIRDLSLTCSLASRRCSECPAYQRRPNPDAGREPGDLAVLARRRAQPPGWRPMSRDRRAGADEPRG
jgi:hypothetical protein